MECEALRPLLHLSNLGNTSLAHKNKWKDVGMWSSWNLDDTPSNLSNLARLLKLILFGYALISHQTINNLGWKSHECMIKAGYEGLLFQEQISLKSSSWKRL